MNKHMNMDIPYLNFGDPKEFGLRRTDPVQQINSQKQESIRKHILSIVKELRWNKCKLSPGVSMAHLYTNRDRRLVLGLIKMESQSIKVFQNTGPVYTRLVVLTGEVNIQIEQSYYPKNDVNTIICIPMETCYSITNNLNDDTYLFFRCGSSF